MSDDDLDLCRKAFPALAWEHLDGSGETLGRLRPGVPAVARVAAWYPGDTVLATVYAHGHHAGSKLCPDTPAALGWLRTTLAALHADLGAALAKGGTDG